MLVLSPVTGHGRESASPVLVPYQDLRGRCQRQQPAGYIAGNQLSESYVKWP
jgi:hypothetical protein